MSALAGVRKLFAGENRTGHGPWDEADSGYVDPKPYVRYFSNGLFLGEDGSLWKYFRSPKDVQIEWLKNPAAAVENQAFFTEAFTDFGALLDGQTEKVRNDVRRPFHVQVTQTPTEGITPPATSPAAHRDFLDRIGVQYKKPQWFSYVGVQILPTTIFHEAYGIRAQIKRYADVITDAGAVRWALFQRDMEDADAIMKGRGFTELDFVEHPEDFEQLTAWHGIPDERYAMPRQLQNVRMKEPIHGKSVLVPKWGEVMFHAIGPSDGTNLRNPVSESARWATPLFRAGSNVVLINIRGQIRAPKIADNLLDIKKATKREAVGKNEDTDAENVATVDLIQLARQGVRTVKLPMLDNTEIVVGSLVPEEGTPSPLPKLVSDYGVEARPLIGRQHLGVLTSFPTYPRHVMRIPRGNRKRPELTNVMLPGMIAMSGIFRSTKPCGPDGVMIGLSDAGDQFDEIYTETDAASKRSAVPGMLVTGRPGAGKALALDTPVMTPDGPVAMGDLVVGDTVYGSDGRPCSVTFATEVMTDHEVFRVTLSDGQSFLADADHQWVVQGYSERVASRAGLTNSDHVATLLADSREREAALLRTASGYGPDETVTLTSLLDLVREVLGETNTWTVRSSLRHALEFNDTPYAVGPKNARVYPTAVALKSLATRVFQTRVHDAELGKRTRRMTTGEMHLEPSDYSIPMTDGVEYPERDLELDPYVLGAWLGDGTLSKGRIASGNVGLSVDEHGVGDQHYMAIELAEYDPRPSEGSMRDYVLNTRGLAPRLRAAGVLHDKHVPDHYLYASRDQRIALLQGLLDTDGTVTSEGAAKFSNTDIGLVESVVSLARSLGFKVVWSGRDCSCGKRCVCDRPAERPDTLAVLDGREIVPRKESFGVVFLADVPVFRLPRKVRKQKMTRGAARSRTVMIRSIEPVETVPVRCISVDSADHTYLIGDAVVTSNTMQLLMMATQIAYRGLPVAYFNPKKEGSLQPTFDHLGGITISMKRDYLLRNPGMMDPVFFITDRSEVADLLSDSIFLANRMYEDSGSEANERRTTVRTEILERAQDLRNKTSSDIIFGNGRDTHPISDEKVAKFVRDRIKTSPFWTAFVSFSSSSSRLKDQMSTGRSFLIEWDSSMQLPSADTPQREYTDPQLDTVLSVNVSFAYASAIVANSGGAIIVDESWVLKNSKEALAILERGGREWRQKDIMLIMGTQRILDWIDRGGEAAGKATTNLSSYFARFLFMAINEQDRNEVEVFFEMTGMPPTDAMHRYITRAGVTKSASGVRGNSVAKGFYMDMIYDWSGGVICGPWPRREFAIARTDKEGLAELRAKSEAEGALAAVVESETKSLYGGALGSVLADRENLVDEPVEVAPAAVAEVPLTRREAVRASRRAGAVD